MVVPVNNAVETVVPVPTVSDVGVSEMKQNTKGYHIHV